MKKQEKNIDLLRPNEELIKLIDCIHQFSCKLIETKTEEDIYRLLVEDLPIQMGINDYAMFIVNKETKELKNIVSVGNTDLRAIQTLKNDSSVRDEFGISSNDDVTHPASSSETTNNFKIITLGSEIIVPVEFKGNVSALIVGRYSNQDVLIEPHRKLWEAVTSLTGCAITKLREKNEIEEIRYKLETILEKKDTDLGKIIDILSSKNSELKYYNEKQKELIQELHHRVTNNLQTISSIVRLYKYSNQKDSQEVLKEIYNRVQILAIIYQNIYKSMEKDYADIQTFLHDVISYLKSTSSDTKVTFNINSEVRSFNYNILISLGLFVAEVFYSWLEKSEKNGINHIEFNLSVEGSNASNSITIRIKDEEETVLMNLFKIESSENVSDIMISGLVDQLEGEVNQGFDKGNFIDLKFKY